MTEQKKKKNKTKQNKKQKTYQILNLQRHQ